jgi:hypothetical protein
MILDTIPSDKLKVVDFTADRVPSQPERDIAHFLSRVSIHPSCDMIEKVIITPTNSSEHQEYTHSSDDDLSFTDILGPFYSMPCLRLLSIYFPPHTVSEVELMALYHALPRLSCLKLENPPLVSLSTLRLFVNCGSPPGDGTPFSMFTLKIDEDVVVRHPLPLIKCPIMLSVWVSSLEWRA